MHHVGDELGGGGDVVLTKESGVDEVAIAARIDEEVGGEVVETATKDEQVGASGMKVEVTRGGGGSGDR